MICPKCEHDHTVENEGALTVCERVDYFSQGGWSTSGREKHRAFGAGEARFQLETVKKKK